MKDKYTLVKICNKVQPNGSSCRGKMVMYECSKCGRKARGYRDESNKKLELVYMYHDILITEETETEE